MKRHTKSFYEGDFEIEGAILKTFARGTYNAAADAMGYAKPIAGRTSKSGSTLAMKNAIKRARQLGLTDAEILDCVRLNLRTYGFDDTTFPIDRWM